MNSVVSKSRPFKTADASSGSTLEMKPVFSFSVPSAAAAVSRAKQSARGPRSEPPIPIWTTFSNGLPVEPVISPL